MGHDYKGGSVTYHCLADNMEKLTSEFTLANGFFGELGDSRRSSIRHIESDDPLVTAKHFYDIATYGGLEERLGEGKWKTTMEDGTVFVMREVSSSDGSPAVDINIQYSTDSGDVKTQKIHFIQKED